MNKALLDQVVKISRNAGHAILEVYNRSEGFEVDAKADDSPVTEADLAAHAILEPALEALIPGVPVLSEESHLPPYSIRSQWQRYWIIDPLDGTKEFIKRNGEFTVNVALIENGKPVLGVVYVPVLDITYTGLEGKGAWKITEGQETPIHVRTVQSRLDSKAPIEVVASRNHGAEEVVHLMERLQSQVGPVETKNMGSSLKLCLVAEGQADLYPRLALTSEWDTAAAQAVVEAAGGLVVDTNFTILRYNTKEDILNPFFHVIGDTQFNWRDYLITQ
ncbi:3'(2'),5'-bisphosphate nucleotidase CysQ [Marinibactrum halimedae]|uniref:3'(2'),5'-bisphosphate nucleotidase CysQ n=1 Tax=Marinibactrum halimedae TaxID=1444977 RepID=A0AA37WP87_9GAMM|nr:3'(2'),5'-bisphosphate nucleotidase CysQ [Marinibactrum halimedae]MCD9460460.1 3'(2'),5'-bisphosphate nucleotidase CysQ [Marinibactrum halimedae]GLS25867.1 3'(2'),5'-bisphosphate nucleotidase CysQ [Marinibactrum halimedae]